MKTLYIHIGTAKTGSTAIQNFCRKNSSLLEKQGYIYPIFPYVYHRCAIERNALFLHKKYYEGDIWKPDEEEKRLKEGLDTIITLFESYDNVVLSDETLWKEWYKRRKTLWKDLKLLGSKNHFTPKVIIYLRRQDQLIESWWNQYVKSPTSLKEPWEDYFTRMKSDKCFDYYKIISEVAQDIGKENIIVRRFNRKYFPEGLVQYDFLDAIGLKVNDKFELSFDTANLRLSGNTHEIKRILNTLLPEQKGDKLSYLFRTILLSYSELSGQIYANNMFSVDEAKAFVQTFQEGNRKIAEEYLHEKDSDLFDMNFKNVPKWKKDNPYMADDIIRFIGASNLHFLHSIETIESDTKQMKGDCKLLSESMDIISKSIDDCGKISYPPLPAFLKGNLKKIY